MATTKKEARRGRERRDKKAAGGFAGREFFPLRYPLALSHLALELTHVSRTILQKRRLIARTLRSRRRLLSFQLRFGSSVVPILLPAMS